MKMIAIRTAVFLTGAAFLTPLAAQEGLENASDQAAALHVLNRITFGPRPGDVEAVEKMGIRQFIEQQLHPETLDDSKVDQEIAQYDLLAMNGAEMTRLYYEEKKTARENVTKKIAAQIAAENAAKSLAAPPAVPPANAVPAQESDASMQPANAGAPPAMASDMANPGFVPRPPREKRVKPGRHQTIAGIGELEESTLVRAVDSNRQLQEVLVNFWENHFNVDAKKGPDRILNIIEDRDVIRPHIWGTFRELLEATAKSPAMLYYLDNQSNTVQRTLGPREKMARARFAQLMPGLADAVGISPDPAKQPKKVGGINENYGRELMELHTVGVNAGYTQKDVQEVARCFTGWGFDRMTGVFVFKDRDHDNGPKMVLGHAIPANGGVQDGEAVLDILASSPACAHFISREMCQRFVSDNPSDALVDRIAGVFTRTNGNLRSVTEAILTSPEFLSPSSYGNKIKSPMEFTVSAVRATSSTVTPMPMPLGRIDAILEGTAVLGRAKAADQLSLSKTQSLNWHVFELGEPLFACTPPTGYGENSTKWVSPGALIERLNFAMALTEQKVSDVTFDAKKILTGVDLDHPEEVLNQCVAVLLNDHVTNATLDVLRKTALPSGESQTVNPSKLIALILGSPEFQRK